MRPCAALAAIVLLVGCGRAAQRNGAGDAGAAHGPKTAAPAGGEIIFNGACDASGAVPLSEDSFLVADDEDNVLRTYDARRGGAPISTLEISTALALRSKGKRQRFPEADIEAATTVGERSYFLTSHGRNASGKLKPERFRFFATEPRDGVPEPVGQAYERLLDDLLNEERLAPFGLRAASELPPKAEGGLNLEGMTARNEGGVWIGFRNPIPAGRALLIPLLNPEGLIEGQNARFGDPVTLELGGLGVRGLSSWRGRYLISAGPYDSGSSPRLFVWDGRANVTPVANLDLAAYNPEAFFTPKTGDRIMLLSDDGSLLIDGTECKRLKDHSKKRFRGLWVTLPGAAPG